jgi:DNA-binding IclR family transcriptional regulator
MVYIMQSLATSMLAVNSPPGSRRPLHSSAVGKAYLSSLPEAELEKLLSILELTQITPATITSAEELKANLRQGRSRGFFTDIGEMNSEVICLAAPIRDNTGKPIASIGISGPRTDPAFAKVDRLGKIVQREATIISTFLGFVETPEEKIHHQPTQVIKEKENKK